MYWIRTYIYFHFQSISFVDQYNGFSSFVYTKRWLLKKKTVRENSLFQPTVALCINKCTGSGYGQCLSESTYFWGILIISLESAMINCVVSLFFYTQVVAFWFMMLDLILAQLRILLFRTFDFLFVSPTWFDCWLWVCELPGRLNQYLCWFRFLTISVYVDSIFVFVWVNNYIIRIYICVYITIYMHTCLCVG